MVITVPHLYVCDSVAIVTDCTSSGGVATVLADDDREESSTGSVSEAGSEGDTLWVSR